MMAAWIRLCLAGLLFVVLLPPRAATTHDSPLLDALEEAAGDFLAVYEGIARGSPCSSERLQESCLDEDFVFFGNAQLATVPSLLATACTSTQLQSVWEKFARNFTQSVNSLYVVEAGGNFFAGVHRQGVGEEFCQQLDQQFDPRSLPAYSEAISSPKSVAIVNLDANGGATSETNSLEAIEVVLTETLNEEDYVALFSPGISMNDTIQATETTITELVSQLAGASLPETPDLRLLSDAINVLQDTTANPSPCYQALVVFLDSSLLTSQELREMITLAFERNENLTVFLNVLDGLSIEEFANASRLFCSTKTVIQSIGEEGYRNRSVVNYLNYFFHGTGSQVQDIVVLQNNTAVFTSETVTTACIPLIDYNIATVSATGVLLGVMCTDLQNTDLQETSICPREQLDLFEFSYLRHAYQLRGPNVPHYQYHCEIIDLPDTFVEDGEYLDLLEEFNTAASTVGHFSFEIVQSDFVNSTCATITGRVPTSCEENSSAMFTSDPNFLQPVSFSSSFLVWRPDLESILPITSTDFNSLDSNQAIWQSVCASSYLEDSWRAVLTANPPSTFMYGDYSYGYTRVYPGSRSSAAGCGQIESMDARLQPWFVSAATGQKAVVILTDIKFGFQDDIQEIKTALLTILNTLSQQDLFNIIITNSQEHRFDSLMPATLSNIAMATDYINQSDYSPESRDPNSAIQLAIQNLNNSLYSAQYNLALIVLTDNSFVDPSSFEFTSVLHRYIPFFTQSKIRVYTFLFSLFQEGTLLKNISCTTSGLYDRLHENPATEIALRVTAYYKFYAASVQLNIQLWSEYFTDELTGLNSTRVCGPFYPSTQQEDTFNSLIGVSCIDIPIEDFTTVQTEALNSRIYSTSLQAVRPNLTFEQENQLRGIHMCDAISATSAESFRFRVENAVRLFRTTAENAFTDVTIPGISSCPFGDRFFGSCDRTQRPPTAFSTPHNCNISTSSSAVYSRGFLAGFIPVLNFSIIGFGLGSDTFDRLCMSQGLDNLWTDGSNSELGEDGMLWHYYADSTAGFLRYQPYADCGLSELEQCQTRAYDPRFRPWYVSSTSASKAVYIIIHATQSSSFSVMQHGTLDVLDTLTHRDFVHVRFAISPNPQLFEGFLRSNTSTRMQLIDFIEAQQFTAGTADLFDVFTSAYQTFQAASTNEEVNNCHQTIIFLTDSSLDQALPTTIGNLRQGINFPVDIFTFSFGGLVTDPTFAQQIACENGGEWFSVSDLSGFEETIHSYYRFYSASVQNAGVVWSDFFTDIFSKREVTSACLPVYDPRTIEQAPLLLGVTCIDVDPERFNDFPDGMEVLQSVVAAEATVCPARVITEEKREALRATKCLPPSLATPQELATFYEASVQNAAESHSQAYTEVVRSSTSSESQMCLFDIPLYDSCAIISSVASRFSPSDQFAANVSFEGLGLVFAPSLQELVDSGSVDLQTLTSDQPLFTSLCPAVVEERTWQRSTGLYSNTSLQFFASEEGFLLTYPARQLSQEFCQGMYDPRVRPFYANTASGYKDVLIIIDLAATPGILSPFLQAATENILLTMSVLDYFTIIAGETNFTPGLVRANTTTISEATAFIGRLVYSPLEEQHLLVRRAFEVLQNSRLSDNSATCQSAIIIITNRDITMETVSEVTVQNEQFAQEFSRPVNVFVNSFGDPSYSGREFDLVCENSGIWNVISPDEFADAILIQETVSSYYEVLAKAITLQDPIWSEIYQDAFGIGLVTTVCLPVYDTAINLGRLLGVSCIDVPMTVFQQFENGVQFLQDLIESQQETRCSPLTLSVDEIDVLRPEGLKCLQDTIPPPTTATSEQTDTTQPSGGTEASRGIHSGAIVGIVFAVIGATVLLSIVVGACIAYCYRRRQKKGSVGFTDSHVLEERLLDNLEDVDSQ